VIECTNSTDASTQVVFDRPDVTGIEQCEGCGGWIVGGMSYWSDGKRYCPNCMFDGSGRFIDGMSIHVRHWEPVAETTRALAATGEGNMDARDGGTESI